MITKIIVTVVFVLSTIFLMYGAFHSIRENEKELALIYSYGSTMFGTLSGILLGCLLI